MLRFNKADLLRFKASFQAILKVLLSDYNHTPFPFLSFPFISRSRFDPKATRVKGRTVHPIDGKEGKDGKEAMGYASSILLYCGDEFLYVIIDDRGWMIGGGEWMIGVDGWERQK